MRRRGLQDNASDGCPGILHKAAAIVAQRRQQYGPPAEHFEHVAPRGTSTLGTAVTPQKVLLCQLDLKLVRLAYDPAHRDSLVDVIGYSVLLHELLGDASAHGPAEVAELAEAESCAGIAAAEAPRKSAERYRKLRLT